MEIRLDGQTAVVFGGSRGIGYAIATELAEAGAVVYIGNRQEKNAEKACWLCSLWNDKGGRNLSHTGSGICRRAI